ncbi:MAG: PilZ domain-containing protein [Hyphomicrobium sp.]
MILTPSVDSVMDGFGRRSGLPSAKALASAPQAAGADQRFAPRRKGQLPAQIYFDGAVECATCLVKDMSATGARLEMRTGWDNAFRASVDGVERAQLIMRQDRVMYECKVVRKGETEIGVKFLSMPKPIQRNGR